MLFVNLTVFDLSSYSRHSDSQAYYTSIVQWMIRMESVPPRGKPVPQEQGQLLYQGVVYGSQLSHYVRTFMNLHRVSGGVGWVSLCCRCFEGVFCLCFYDLRCDGICACTHLHWLINFTNTFTHNRRLVCP